MRGRRERFEERLRRRDRARGPDQAADRERTEPAPATCAVHATIVLNMRLTALGDLLLDVIVRLDDPLVPGDDRMAETRVVAGGQAANVAAWASSLGAEARFVGRRGDDDAGEIVARALSAHGVHVVGPVSGRTGVVVSIASDGDRTMASDRGSAPDLAPHDLDESWFDCDVLHLSGYSLLREPISAAAIEAARSTRLPRRDRCRRRLDVVAGGRAIPRVDCASSRPTWCSRRNGSRLPSVTLEDALGR